MAMDDHDVLVRERHGRALLLVLNRPDALNACNDALYNAIVAALGEAAADDDVACVVLTGAGRAFCAGQDLAELADARSHEARTRDGFRPFIEALESFPKPLIAAVNGIGVGIGLTMLPHCDIVLMAEEARLRAPFVSLGVCIEAGNSYLLAERLGHARTAQLLFTGGWLDAATALDAGLALEVVAQDALRERALELARDIAAMPVPALVANKKLLLAARLDAVRAARAREDGAFAQLVGGPANREAMAAFREKRAPDFTRLPES
jgi:enoyl-CoA hydratase/carnithine racemase